MNGLKANGVSIFLGQMPRRKGLAFYFVEGVNGIPVAYVSKKNEDEAKRLWLKLVGDDK